MEEKLFNELLDSVNEMVAIEKGELEPKPEHVHSHSLPDVKALRMQFGMKQSEFAQAIGASPALVQSWELNRRVPTGIALKMLRLLEQDPKLMDSLKQA